MHDVNAMFLYNQKEYDNGDALPYRTQGIAGRFSYTYDSRYVAELNFGYNGSENFAKGKRFGFFPAVALGWIVSSEKFMEPVSDVISNLKLRATWGKAGNSNMVVTDVSPIFLPLSIPVRTDGVQMRKSIALDVRKAKSV